MKLTSLRDPAEMKLERIEQHPKYQAVVAELAALERRFEEAQRRERVAIARGQGQTSSRGVLDRARDLLAGGRIVASDPGAESAAALEEQVILKRAIFAARDRLDALRGELSFTACERFAPLTAEALRAALAAAEALFESLEVARTIRGRLIGAGYQLNESAMPIEQFPEATVLGDPRNVGMTASARFRQRLIDKRVISP